MPLAAPLTFAEAEHCLEPLNAARRILLAVSGGPDSVALMGFAATIAAKNKFPPLAVATVDHRLQPGSDRVAEVVVRQARGLGIEAHVLHWDGPKPSAGVQSEARQARYDLLVGLCERLHASHLLTAHTLDDQAETILFRLARGSGLRGLAGMHVVVRRGSTFHMRPFLTIPKLRLVEACREHGWTFVDDPTNRDLQFARARMRRLLPLLATEGLDAAMLATLGRRAAENAAAIGEKAAAALEASLVPPIRDDGRCFAAAHLVAEPTAILVRAMEMSLTDFAHIGPPPLGRLEALVGDLQDAFRHTRPIRRTLHGAIVAWRPGSHLEITRETRRSVPVPSRSEP